MSEITGRITYKKLIDWLNQEFARLEINSFEVIEAYRTYYTSGQYENGACKLIIKFQSKEIVKGHRMEGSFFSFYFIKELQWYVENGYNLHLKFSFRSTGMSLNDLELDVIKK